MKFHDLPRRPQVYFDLYFLPATGEHFGVRRDPVTLKVTGCLPLPFPYCRRIPLEGLPYDGDQELVPWFEEHRAEFDLTG
jgi:hypothetical protein